MSLATPEKIQTLQRKLCLKAKREQDIVHASRRSLVREPDAGRSSRQGCNPVGGSPTMSVAHVGHVAMPHLRAGNRLGDAWCKRPGRPTDLEPLRREQSGVLASVGA